MIVKSGEGLFIVWSLIGDDSGDQEGIEPSDGSPRLNVDCIRCAAVGRKTSVCLLHFV